jgi:hypothetical protein
MPMYNIFFVVIPICMRHHKKHCNWSCKTSTITEMYGIPSGLLLLQPLSCLPASIIESCVHRLITPDKDFSCRYVERRAQFCELRISYSDCQEATALLILPFALVTSGFSWFNSFMSEFLWNFC